MKNDRNSAANAGGVRPSSGAAIGEMFLSLISLTSANHKAIAAPEDGRTPHNGTIK
jgi:hypothetical protein